MAYILINEAFVQVDLSTEDNPTNQAARTSMLAAGMDVSMLYGRPDTSTAFPVGPYCTPYFWVRVGVRGRALTCDRLREREALEFARALPGKQSITHHSTYAEDD